MCPTGFNPNEGINAFNVGARVSGQCSSNGPHATPILWQHFVDDSVGAYDMGDATFTQAFDSRRQHNLMAITRAVVSQIFGEVWKAFYNPSSPECWWEHTETGCAFRSRFECPLPSTTGKLLKALITGRNSAEATSFAYKSTSLCGPWDPHQGRSR